MIVPFPVKESTATAPCRKSTHRPKDGGSMITTAKEFVALRTSAIREEHLRAATENAPLAVWLEVVSQYPDMKVWAVRNKTVPIEILESLSADRDPSVRVAVAMKNSLSEGLMLKLARDSDQSARERIAYNKNISEDALRCSQRTQWRELPKEPANDCRAANDILIVVIVESPPARR